MINNTVVDINNSTLRETGHGSTPKHKIVVIEKWIQNNNASHTVLNNDSSTPALPTKPISEEAITQFSDEVKNKERQYDQVVKRLENKLKKVLKDYSLESETLSEAEIEICEIAEEYSLRLLGEVLTGIYISCYDQQNVIAGICYSLERFDAAEVFPWGQSIVIGLVNHKSNIVKERVISLIENWGDVSLLPALKNIDISSVWMQEYVKSVIKYLEDKQCIM